MENPKRFLLFVLVVCGMAFWYHSCESKEEKLDREINELIARAEATNARLTPTPDKRKLNYEIVDTDIVETKNKAQIKKYVAYTDSIFDEEALSAVLHEVYYRNRNANVFKNFHEPTLIAVYVFTSAEQAQNDRGSWIAMLTKGSNDVSPRLNYNDLKLKSLAGLNDNVKSKDEIALDKLNDYLDKKNVTLCDLYKQVVSYERDNILKADAKYPDYGKDHLGFVTELDKAERNRMMKKHQLADSVFMQIVVFGTAYCK